MCTIATPVSPITVVTAQPAPTSADPVPEPPSGRPESISEGLWRRKPVLNQLQVDSVYEVLAGTARILDSCGIRWHLVAGSMLGLARHRGLIPWDDDVDIGIHADDADKLWKHRDQFLAFGCTLVRAELGFKCGPGRVKYYEPPGAWTTIDDVPTYKMGGGQNVHEQCGSATPFESELTHLDIFTFREDGEVEGAPVLRYTSERAREYWPREVIPVSAWYAEATKVPFGEYVMVPSLPAEGLEWCLSTAYGAQWRTQNGAGEQIVDFSFARHSSLKGAIEESVASAGVSAVAAAAAAAS